MADISQFKDRKTDTLYNIKDVQARTVKEDIDRPDNTDGMAKMVIKKTVPFASQLTQSKTTYVIRNNFDLNGGTITLPANSVLKFEGGSISNGTLVGNKTVIEAQKGIQIFDTITIQGTWQMEVAYSSWFKTYKQGYRINNVAESSTVLYKGTDNNYYDFEDLTKVGNDYYVTSTLEEGEVVEGSIKVTATTYSTFKVVGDNTDYIISSVAGVPGMLDWSGYVQYDDTAALQSLFDIRARKTIVEDGVYMVKCDAKVSGDNYVGLYYDGHNDSELIIDGWLKAIPNSRSKYHMLDVIGCRNIRITGNGGVQGDLLEHIGTGGEAGMCLSVSNTKGLYVEGLTFAYAWGDCAYMHWWSHGRESVIARGNGQSHLTFYNARFIYGGRTGFVVERGDNVVVDSCYFYGSGIIRGKETRSAVDIEPFGSSDVSRSFVRNYEFKNNTFEHSYRGLRIERCFNVSIHDNYFEDAQNTAIIVYDHQDQWEYKGNNNKWTKSIVRIYDNNIRRAGYGIAIGQGIRATNNVDVHNNLLVSCNYTLSTGGTLNYCNFHDNTMYGCGTWYFGGNTVNYCDFFNNRSYGTNPATISFDSTRRGRFLYHACSGSSVGSKIHDNYFSLDYGKPLYGLGELGTEELYHGLPIGQDCGFAYGFSLNNSSAFRIFNNYISDDFFLAWPYNAAWGGGLNSVRTEDSEVFVIGDTFKSSYGDEGTVTGQAMLSYSWLANARHFEASMEVARGEVIIIDSDNTTYYKVCSKSGACGETITKNQTTCGTAVFLADFALMTPKGTLAIRYNTRGYCTSDARPSTFNFKGRKMYETDTGKDIIYNGSAWVYEDETPIVDHGTEDTGTSSSRYAVTPKVLHVWGEVASLYLSLKAGDAGFAQTYTMQFTSGATATVLNISGTIKWVGGVGPSSIEASKTYVVTITNGIGQIQAAQ